MGIMAKHKIRRKISVVMLAVFWLSMPLQAESAEIVTGDEMETEDAEKVQVSELDLGEYTDKMLVGEKQLLSVTVLPIEVSEVPITYSSSDTNVATINGMGRITALALGRTTITVTSGGISQCFELQVVEKEENIISVTNIEIGEHESEIEVGKTITLSGTVIPSDATNATITYTSSDSHIATVSSSGEVKGISKGNVTITLAAGEISKTIALTVKVATTGITLDKDYLVLKSGETYQLSAKVMPIEANQTVTYRSVDISVATVSQEGFVIAKGIGSTTIIVSNGDISIAVSVIVNETVSYRETEDKVEQDSTEVKIYQDCIGVSEQSIVNSEMLYHLYETGQVLKIKGDGYVIKIDGKDIVNYSNVFYTDILLIREEGKLSFNLNQGNELCGAVTLYLEEAEGKYLYLYNISKEKYERVDVSNLKELKLTTAGEYQLRETKLKSDFNIVLCTVMGGMVLLLIGVGAYIIVKKKYWFW